MGADMYEKIADGFNNDYNCCQTVLRYACEKLGVAEDTALRLAAGFGGGMRRGETCGCVTAALMALGMAYGSPTCETEKARFKEFVEEFESRFRNKNGSLLCRELLGMDFGKPEEREKILESGILKSKCPQLACDASFILDKMLLSNPQEMGVGCSCGNH